MSRLSMVVIALAVSLGAARLLAADLQVTVRNPPASGSVVILVFDSAATFVDLRDPLKTISLPVSTSMPVRINGLSAGEYAVVVYQDVNGNGQLDKNFIGIPREPLGFSNRYRPQGPPSFARAAVPLAEGETRPCDVELKPILGKSGRLGVGAGFISQTSPYRDSSKVIIQPIPVISYVGDRVQILGPAARVGLVSRGDMTLAATARYRMGAYDEDDSPILEGLGDRDSTLMGGLAFRARMPAGVKVTLGYENDLLDRTGGGVGHLGVDKGFQRGLVTVSPQIGLNWMTSELADYEFGVPDHVVREGRPAYHPGDALSLDVGASLFLEMAGAWRLIVTGSVTFLPPELTDSPLVDQDQVFNCFAAINRLL